MTAEQRVTLVQRQVEAYNKSDLEDFCAQYHQEILITELFTGKVLAQGMAQFRKLYDEAFRANANLSGEVKRRLILPSTIVDEEWILGLRDHPQGLHVSAIYSFRDGKIDKVTFAY